MEKLQLRLIVREIGISETLRYLLQLKQEIEAAKIQRKEKEA